MQISPTYGDAMVYPPNSKNIIMYFDFGFLLIGLSYSSVSGNKKSPNKGDADIWVVKIDSVGRKEDSRVRPELKYSVLYKSRNRANSVESLLSDNSAASTYAGEKYKSPSIYEKYSKSPYVKSGYASSPKHK